MTSRSRGNNYSGKLSQSPDSIYLGTQRESPGGAGGVGAGCQVWKSTDGGAWTNIVMDGFLGGIDGAVATMSYLNGKMVLGIQNHSEGSRIIVLSPDNSWVDRSPESSGILPPKSAIRYQNQI